MAEAGPPIEGRRPLRRATATAAASVLAAGSLPPESGVKAGERRLKESVAELHATFVAQRRDTVN